MEYVGGGCGWGCASCVSLVFVLGGVLILWMIGYIIWCTFFADTVIHSFSLSF